MWDTFTLFLLIIALAESFVVELGQFTDEQIAKIGNIKTLLKDETKEDFILEDYFLGQWLYSTNFDVKKTHGEIQQYNEWRERHNMSTILAEEWTDMRVLFPYSRDTFDKMGQPVLYIDSGKWDISGYFAENPDASVDRLARYILMLPEESHAHVRKLRAEGKAVTKFSEVVNLGGFGLQNPACLQCLSAYHKMNQSQPPFQGMILSRLVFINVPFAFRMVYSIFGEESEMSLHRLYGQDREQWEQGLLELMDKEQFPKGIFGEISAQDNHNGLLNWNDEL